VWNRTPDSRRSIVRLDGGGGVILSSSSVGGTVDVVSEVVVVVVAVLVVFSLLVPSPEEDVALALGLANLNKNTTPPLSVEDVERAAPS